MLLGDHGLLGRVHAAHGRAVLLPALLLGPGSAALDESDLGGVGFGVVVYLIIRNSNVSLVRSRSAHHPLVLDGGDDVLVSAVSVLGGNMCVPDLESGRSDDGSDLEDLLLILVIVVDGSLSASLEAVTALVFGKLHALVLVDNCDTGNSLCVGYVDCFPVDKSELVLVGDVLDRTLGDTVTASSTLTGVDVPCFLEDGDLEVSRLSIDFQNLVIGQNIDVRVSVTVRHLRRKDTRGTVVRREGLVQTAHHSSDGRISLYQVDVNAAVCKIQRSLDSSDSSTDNQCRFAQIIASVYQLVFGTIGSNGYNLIRAMQSNLYRGTYRFFLQPSKFYLGLTKNRI